MIKIISIGWYKVLPPQFGGQKGIALFNKYLSRLHPLVFLCSRNNEFTSDTAYPVLPELPVSKPQFLNPLCWRKIIKAVKKNNATHIILEHPYHGIAAYLAKKRTGIKLIVHSHNIESLRFKELGKWWWRLLSKYERWVHRKADLSLFKTKDDLEYAVAHFKLAADRCIVIPYGIEINKNSIDKKMTREIIAARHDIPADHKILLFAGTLDYLPNAKAVEVIYKEIVPVMKQVINFPFKIIICGRIRHSSFQYLEKLHHPDIIHAGEVDDIENYFSAADVFINPVSGGGGIQTKTMDALAGNLNVILTTNGVAGLPEYLFDKKIFISKPGNWTNFSQQISIAINNQENTPEKFYTDFCWQSIINKLSEKIDTLPDA